MARGGKGKAGGRNLLLNIAFYVACFNFFVPFGMQWRYQRHCITSIDGILQAIVKTACV